MLMYASTRYTPLLEPMTPRSHPHEPFGQPLEGKPFFASWSGDGADTLAPPVLATRPTWSGDGQRGTPPPPPIASVTPPWTHQRTRAAAIPHTPPVRPRPVRQPATQTLTVSSTRSDDSWKLAWIAVLFFVWIATACSFLYLYMDRYLLP